MFNSRTAAQEAQLNALAGDALLVNQLKSPYFNQLVQQVGQQQISLQNQMRISQPGPLPQQMLHLPTFQGLNKELLQRIMKGNERAEEMKPEQQRTEKIRESRGPIEIISVDDSSEEDQRVPERQPQVSLQDPVQQLSFPMSSGLQPNFVQFLQQQPMLANAGQINQNYSQALGGRMMQFLPNPQAMMFQYQLQMAQLQQTPQSIEGWMKQQQYAQIKQQMMTPMMSQMMFQPQRQPNEPVQPERVEKQTRLSPPSSRKDKRSVVRKETTSSDKQNNMVSINKTKVKINLKKLKEMESTDKNDLLDINNLDLYRAHKPTNSIQNWDLRKRVKRDFRSDEPNSLELNSKVKTYTRTAVHVKQFNSRNISTRRTQIEDPKVETQPAPPPQVIFHNNDGFMRIGTNYQADLSKIRIKFLINLEEPEIENFENLKQKLLLQRVWNGAQDKEIYHKIMERVSEQVYPNITHYDVLIILNQFKNNLPLLLKKLNEKDPIVAHDLQQLKLSFKQKRKFLKKYQTI